jgi:2-(1,2-epoxy-1,2-dihydrophenyl)acetyl-CoA isomerase
MDDHTLADELVYTVDDRGIATIRFNRPAALNAMSARVADELLPQACAAAASDPAVRVVVLTGTGRAFCAGADVKQRIPAVSGRADATTLERPLGAFVEPVWRLPKPVIAAVNGVAAGGGMSLATAADFRIILDSAELVPAVGRRGMMADSGITFTLPRIVGASRALRMLMTGDSISAAEALAVGLADQIAPAAEFGRTVAAFADRLANGPSIALSYIKRALGDSARSTLTAQLEVESWGAMACFRSQDFQEGLAAFAEHRQPIFEGQ